MSEKKFNDIVYETPAELIMKLIKKNRGEPVRPKTRVMTESRHDLGRQLVSLSVLPEHRVMKLIAREDDTELHVFDFHDEGGKYTILMYLDEGGTRASELYAIDYEGALEVLFQLRESAEIERPSREDTGYLMEKALGMSSYKHNRE